MAKILFITSRFPYPLNKGDKLRVYFQLKHLAEANEIHLIAVNDTKVSELQFQELMPLCKSIHVFVLPLYKRIFQLLLSPLKGIPLQVAFFYSKSIKKQIVKLTNEINPDHIHCHLIRTTEYVKGINHSSKSVDFMDAFGKGLEKRQISEQNVFKRYLYAYEKRLVYNYEAKVFSFMDKFIIISEQDKSFIKSKRANEIVVIPNGVDFNTFYPKSTEKLYDLLFMGNLSYPPNIDAVKFFASEIMPLLKNQIPEIKILIAGIGAPKSIKKLQSANVDVIENFADISDSIAISKIMIAPMKLSIGLQNKILQAMAMGIPCIVSTLSNNAIQAVNNKDLIEANTDVEFSERIIYLLNNVVKAKEIGQEGYKFVKENYSWKKQNELFVKLILLKN